MDEWTLNDLLECSVCLERLDTSSKVLPCQHTFCKKCLEEIVSTHKELRCPECRVLVDAKIDELPPNVLLMRILEGMRNAAPKKRSPGPNRLQGGSVAPVPSQQMLPPPQQQMTPLVHPCPKQVQPPQPCARAIYDYIAKEPGDLSFKKGDMILLRKKIDTNWYQGETGGHFGAFPLTYVQVITPLPNQIPQCKALYDFRMTNDDDEGCLTFNKGEVITVLRRIDENWAEGRLGDRIGIFPLAFVELNIIARALMKLSTKYIALYPYKPQKADELELKKGGVYLVTERCEDGWFKGTSNRTQKCGVFPGNYVTPANTWTPPAQLSQLRASLTRVSITSAPPTSSSGPASPRASATGGATPPLEPRVSASNYARGKSGSSTTLMPYSPRQQNGIGSQQQLQPPPPELPPRSASPSHNTLTGVSSSWHGQPAGVVASSSASAVPDVAAVGSSAPTSAAPLGRSLSAVLGPGLASAIAAPPNTSITTVSPAPREKGKEKKDKAVSLMRRLTSIKKSKSPPPATYSMDNPVFEDGTVAASPVHPSHPVHPVHVRSGSCPSQLLQALPLDASSAHHRLFGSGSQRLKHKDRPNVVMANLAHFGRTGDPGPVACSSATNHRKSNSLDAGSGDIVRKVSKQLVPPVRERFRCIVPYPPMSEHELELRVGDIIYVHRKRDDGWYKGTQQRTGRTGLFPASFVESF